MKILTTPQLHAVSGGLQSAQAGYISSVAVSKVAAFGIKALLRSAGVAGLAAECLIVPAFELLGTAFGYELFDRYEANKAQAEPREITK